MLMVVYDTIVVTQQTACQLVMEASDDDGKADSWSVNTVSVGYTMGALTVHIELTIKLTQNYDASAAYTMGGTLCTAGTDEIEQHYVGITHCWSAVFDSTH